MDCFDLLALIPDDEPDGGVWKRKRSSTSQATVSGQRKRSSTRQATVSDQSEGVNAEQQSGFNSEKATPKAETQAQWDTQPRDRGGIAATCACSAVQQQVRSGNQA